MKAEITQETLPVKKVCFFALKNGKYLTENGIEITTEMLIKYPHYLSKSCSYIILDQCNT